MAEKLSGGDYDGDIIQIFWDKEFLSFFEPVEPAEVKEKNVVNV